MQAAILTGLYNGAGQPLLSCPTGNCTWTGVTTLGVCSECEDITDQIETKCPGRTIENNGQYECDYLMPQDLILSGWIHSYGGSGIFSQTRWNSSAADLDIMESNLSRGDPALLTVFEAIELSQRKGDELPSPKGSRCTFAFCTKTYPEVHVTNGISDMSAPEEDILLLDQVSNRTCGPSCGPEFFWDMVANTSVHDARDHSKYSVNLADYANIQNYMQELFSIGWDDVSSSTRVPKLTHPITPDVGRELANANDVKQMIQAVAESMTEYIRTGPNSTSQTGQSFINKTFIEIHWGWLAYPIGLMVFTLVLLVTVIVKTRINNTIAWKSSSLALLFHKLEGWEMPEHGISSSQELNRMANKMRVKLAEGENQPAFSKMD